MNIANRITLQGYVTLSYHTEAKIQAFRFLNFYKHFWGYSDGARNALSFFSAFFSIRLT